MGRDQATDIYGTLTQSRTVATGLLTELADAELVIPGIGPDKISDITTNVIRGRLIQYTQNECRVHEIPLVGTVASGATWDAGNERWAQGYVPLPVVNGRKVLLVPKAVVKWDMALTADEYYQHFVLNFLQRQELEAGSALVHLLKNGRRRVTKKDLAEIYPFTKEFLLDFTERNPAVLAGYKMHKLRRAAESLTNQDLAASDSSFLEQIDERELARSMIEALAELAPGNANSTRYESLIIGVLEFIFYPYVINPKAQRRIHDGRKRIDLTYDNATSSGVFRRAAQSPAVNAQLVMVECKNYTHDPENPVLDQLAGRFNGHTRGRLGLLVARKFDNRELFLQRCRSRRSGLHYPPC